MLAPFARRGADFSRRGALAPLRVVGPVETGPQTKVRPTMLHYCTVRSSFAFLAGMPFGWQSAHFTK